MPTKRTVHYGVHNIATSQRSKHASKWPEVEARHCCLWFDKTIRSIDKTRWEEEGDLFDGTKNESICRMKWNATNQAKHKREQEREIARDCKWNETKWLRRPIKMLFIPNGQSRVSCVFGCRSSSSSNGMEICEKIHNGFGFIDHWYRCHHQTKP